MTLLTGRVVHSHEVMAPGVPGPCLVVVDCPTESHLDILASQAGPLTKWTVSSQHRVLGKGGQQLRQHRLAWGWRRGSHILGAVIQRWAIPQRVLERGKPQPSVRGQCKWLVQGVVASEANTVCSGAFPGEQQPCCSITPAASTLSNFMPTI